MEKIIFSVPSEYIEEVRKDMERGRGCIIDKLVRVTGQYRFPENGMPFKRLYFIATHMRESSKFDYETREWRGDERQLVHLEKYVGDIHGGKFNQQHDKEVEDRYERTKNSMIRMLQELGVDVRAGQITEASHVD